VIDAHHSPARVFNSRAPYGEYQSSLSAIGTRNQSHIFWNFDSGDSLGHTATQIKADYTALMNANLNNVIALNHRYAQFACPRRPN